MSSFVMPYDGNLDILSIQSIISCPIYTDDTATEFLNANGFRSHSQFYTRRRIYQKETNCHLVWKCLTLTFFVPS